MSTQVQRRKGTTAQHASFTGASAELTVDTTKNTVVVHDGATTGGIPLAKETGSALSVTSLTSSGAAVIETTDNTNAALRITQLGTGNALLIEDSASPDATPTAIDNSGRVAIGYTTTVTGLGPSTAYRPSLQVHGTANNTSSAGVYNWSSTPALTSAVTFNRSLSNTIGTFAGAVTTGTSLGVLSFSGDDSTSFYEAVRIQAQADGNASAGSMPGRLSFSTTSAGATTPTERMRITSTGNVGVGTTAPAVELEISSATGSATPVPTEMRISTTTSASDWSTTLPWGRLSFYSADASDAGPKIHGAVDMISELANGGRSSMVFSSAVATTGTLTERMRLDSSGNLGLGVTPSAWGSGYKALDIGTLGSIFHNNAGANTWVSNNTYFNGTNWLSKAAGSAQSYRLQADLGHVWRNSVGTITAAGQTITWSDAMTLDASGNLLVGTTSGLGGTRAHIEQNSNANYSTTFTTATTKAQLILRDSSATATYSTPFSTLIFGAGDSGAAWSTITGIREASQSSAIAFGTASGSSNPVERARIDSSGNLLVGQPASSLGGRIEVTAASGYNAVSLLSNSSISSAILNIWGNQATGDQIFVRFATDSNTARGLITYNRAGGLVAYYTTSDYRAKDIIGPVLDSGALIDSVPVYMGKMKGATQERPMFIAHETPAYAHTGEKDAVDADGNPVFQQMDASALVPVLWAELQSLRARVAQLESK